jgi:hypothetical protein
VDPPCGNVNRLIYSAIVRKKAAVSNKAKSVAVSGLNFSLAAGAKIQLMPCQ